MRLDSQAKYGVVAAGEADALRLPTRADCVREDLGPRRGRADRGRSGQHGHGHPQAAAEFGHGRGLSENKKA
ncbi:MAG: hypothetical protein R3F59_36130 [Myxococcota bacterium]